MAIAINGADSGTGADVDTTPKALRTTLYDASGNPIIAQSGDMPAIISGVAALGSNDGALRPLRVDRMGTLATSYHTPIVADSFEGATVNNIRWLITSATMAASQTTVGGLLFNSASIVTANTGYMIQSGRKITKGQRQPLAARFRARLNMQNNSVMEFGFGDAANSTAANSTGAYWQVTASGVVQPVVTFNSTDTTGADIRSSLSTANYYTFDVLVDDDSVTFTCQNTSTGVIISSQTITLPVTGARLWSQIAMPTMCRLYNTATPPATAAQIILTDVYVLINDVNRNQPWAHAVSGMDRGMLARADTAAQLATWANSAEPASLTLSNTAAGMTTLGGKFQFAAVVGAATDYAIVGFQVPATQNLFVTGVDIDVWNLGAAVATTPTLLTWAIAAGSTAVSLATATVMRLGLGANALPIGTVIGGLADRRIQKQFQTPVFCAPGRFLHIILRMPVATNTASQVVAGMINIEGYFE